MTYYVFLENFSRSWRRDKKVVYIVGGFEGIQVDVLNLLEKRLRAIYPKDFSKVVIHMEEHKNSIQRALTRGLFDMRIFIMSKGVLPKEMWVSFFKELKKTQGVSVIVDEEGEMKEQFLKDFPKNSSGVLIDCSKVPSKLESFIRLRVGNISKIALSPEVEEYLMEIPFVQLFPMFTIFEHLNLMNIGIPEIRQFGLLKSNMENIFAKRLIWKGKKELLKYDLSDLDGRKFLLAVYFELVKLLRIKTVKERRPAIVATELKIPMNIFMDLYLPLANKSDLKLLYTRLNLVLTLMKWRALEGIETLFLSLWR